MSKTMSKILLMIVFVLLGISLLRSLYNVQPITFESFLQIVSGIDLDFDSVVYNIAAVGNSFDLSKTVTVVDFDTFLQSMNFILDGILGIISLPIYVIVDLLKFVYSVIGVCIQFLGFNPFVKNG